MTILDSKLLLYYHTIISWYKKYIKNRYITVSCVFLIWMLFFDNDSIVRQFQRKYQIVKLNREIRYYTRELAETKIEEKALTHSDAYFEKFVRENYLLKRKNEDLFIFTEE